jgi:hypothetical protein
MIQSMSCHYSLSTQSGISRGTSEEAHYVATQKDRGTDRLRESFSIGFGLSRPSDELREVAQECGVPGWDGQDAGPITTATFFQAMLLLQSLPLDVTAPSIGAEPDGQLTFEWYQSPSRVLSVSISSEGLLHYAALLGPRRAYGVEPFLGSIPQTIIDLIRQMLRE